MREIRVRYHHTPNQNFPRKKLAPSCGNTLVTGQKAKMRLGNEKAVLGVDNYFHAVPHWGSLRYFSKTGPLGFNDSQVCCECTENAACRITD